MNDRQGPVSRRAESLNSSGYSNLKFAYWVGVRHHQAMDQETKRVDFLHRAHRRTRQWADLESPSHPRQEALLELWAIRIGERGHHVPISAGVLADATLELSPHGPLRPSRTCRVSTLQRLESPDHCDSSTCSSFLGDQVTMVLMMAGRCEGGWQTLLPVDWPCEMLMMLI